MNTIFLHGALGSAASFEKYLSARPGSVALNLPGHGGVPTNGPFSMAGFAESVIQELDSRNMAQADIFGYSMGGYLGLWLAWKHPERLRSIKTYGTKLDWNPEVAAGMSRMFDPEKIEAKAPPLAASLAQQHGPERWKDLCRDTAAFLYELGQGNGLPESAFAEIKCPVTIGWGALDNVVTEAESRKVAELIPGARFVILPEGKHLMEQTELGRYMIDE
ncbi:MAG: alpha/beta hydrolase [Saprospiraceae bacterium]|nr:alpha/beta hydrolase [Saprospiraceae bacterium]